MKRAIFGLAVLAAGILSASTTQASQFAFNFCPGNATCPADLTEASLTFTTNDGTADVNDYQLAVTFKGTSTALFIDAIQFTTDLTLASAPVLTSSPTGTALGDWTVSLNGNVNANGCQVAGSNNKDACAEDTAVNGNGPDTNGTNTWLFNVDFTGTATSGTTSDVNLRALFVNAQGQQSGILSPNGNEVTTTTTVTPTTRGAPTTTGGVPEPALMSMLGLGLVGAAYRSRRR